MQTYHHRKSFKQQGLRILLVGGLAFLQVSTMLHLTTLGHEVSTLLRWGLPAAILLISLLIAARFLRQPGVFEYSVNPQQVISRYPNVAQWSYELEVEKIIRIEQRLTSTADAGEHRAGDGYFLVAIQTEGAEGSKQEQAYPVVENFGNRPDKIIKLLQKYRPELVIEKKLI